MHELEDKNDKLLQDLVLTVHHCYMYSLSNTLAFKIIENHMGIRYVKIFQPQQTVLQGAAVHPGRVQQRDAEQVGLGE